MLSRLAGSSPPRRRALISRVLKPSLPAPAAGLLEAALLVIGLVAMLGLFFATRHALGTGDVTLYHRYAAALWSGAPLDKLLPGEYPALALAVMSLTLLPRTGDPTAVFARWMTAAAAIGYLMMRHFAGRTAALAYAIYLLVGAAITVLARFDIVPALLVLGALFAARRRRFAVAYALLAAGFLVKGFPIALVPLIVLQQRRRELMAGRPWLPSVARAAGPAMAFTAAVMIAVALTGWTHVFWPLGYQSHRPIQVESAAGSALWLFSFLGFPALSAQGYSSADLVGPLSAPVSLAFGAAGVAGLLWTYSLFERGRLELGRSFILVVLVVMLASKVLSPQYLIWVLPLVAAVEGVDAVWLGIAALTTVIYPLMYLEFGLIGWLTPPPYPGLFLLTILVRNLLLGVALVRVLRPGFVFARLGQDRQMPELLTVRRRLLD